MSGGKWTAGLLAVLSVTVLSGCANLIPAQVAGDAMAGFYNTASISYEIDAARNGVPLSVVRIEGRLVSYDEVPAHAVADRSKGTLRIEYPHPRGREGYALARVVIESRDGSAIRAVNLLSGETGWTELLSTAAPWNWFGGDSAGETASAASSGDTARRAKIHETWELDVPKSELDAVIARLNQAGFFDSRAHGGAAVELTARLDGSTVRKRFDPLPELDLLMQRVRGRGQLVSYERSLPASAPWVAAASASAVVLPSALAHRDAQGQGGAISPAAELAATEKPAPRLGSLARIFSRQSNRAPTVTRLPAVDAQRRY